MKLFRTPSIKKSFKARTTGRMKRSMKRAINPTYGKKGMGWVKNPKRAMYNKVYNTCTVDARPMSYVSSSKKSRSKKVNSKMTTKQIANRCLILGILACISIIGLPIGILLILTAIVSYIINAMGGSWF